jgi:hypothetical protein
MRFEDPGTCDRSVRPAARCCRKGANCMCWLIRVPHQVMRFRVRSWGQLRLRLPLLIVPCFWRRVPRQHHCVSVRLPNYQTEKETVRTSTRACTCLNFLRRACGGSTADHPRVPRSTTIRVFVRARSAARARISSRRDRLTRWRGRVRTAPAAPRATRRPVRLLKLL